tara:strand:- start:1025 stop:1216 length:192 start_codon:yes stop_codon:yes gene_type:complete
MSDVVWSINIMIAILLIAVSYTIYWIFTYDARVFESTEGDISKEKQIEPNIPEGSGMDREETN